MKFLRLYFDNLKVSLCCFLFIVAFLSVLLSLYEWQYQSMLQYLSALEARATILGINLHKD